MTQLGLRSNLCLYRTSEEIVVYVPTNKRTYLLCDNDFSIFTQILALNENHLSLERCFATCEHNLNITRKMFQNSIDEFLCADILMTI